MVDVQMFGRSGLACFYPDPQGLKDNRACSHFARTKIIEDDTNLVLKKGFGIYSLLENYLSEQFVVKQVQKGLMFDEGRDIK